MPTVSLDADRHTRAAPAAVATDNPPAGITMKPAGLFDGAHRQGRIVQAACLFVLALVVRLPSFQRPFWSPDEGYLGTEATMLRDGGRMYVSVVDRKPPLVPWLYEGCFALVGEGGLWLVRVLAVVSLGLTAVFTARLAARLFSTWAALPAGALTVAASAALPAPDAMAATFEIFMLPATAAALYYGARGRYLIAGLAVAIATLTKQVGLAPLLPLAVQALTGRRRWRDTVALSAGAVVPIVGCALLLGARRFTFWVFSSSGSYATSPPGTGEVLARASANLAGVLTVFVAALVLAPLLPWRRWMLLLCPGAARHRQGEAALTDGQPASSFHGYRGNRAVDRTIVLWLLASAAGVSVGWHFYGHYYLQIIPPMVLLVLRAVEVSCQPGTGPRPLRRLVTTTGRAGTAAFVAAGALVGAACWTAGAFKARPPQMEKSLAVAAAVQEHAAPGQRVFLWGMHPEIYWLSGRRPSSRYLTAGLLTNFSGGGDVRRVGPSYAVPGTWPIFRNELETTPPCVFVDDSSGTPYALSNYPDLRDLLANGYQQVAMIDGARIFQRGACSA